MKAHSALDNATALLALGGDNLSFDYGFLATLLFFSPLQAAAGKGVPTTVWGASIGPFSTRPRWEKRFADLLRRVDLITVREPVTQGYLDELGFLTLVGRKKDLIITDGYNVYPAVVERVLNSFAQVRESAVIGVPDKRRG